MTLSTDASFRLSVGSSDAAEGENRGFGDFATYEALLKKYFFHKTRSREEANDLTQEAFYRFIRIKDSGKLSKPRAYLFRIATNLLRDGVRRDRARKRDFHVSLEAEAIADTIADPERVVGAKMAVDRLLAAVANLPPKCRRVFVLNRFEGMTYVEIAEHLGISEAMVAKHIRSALVRCREEVDW